MKTLRAAGFLAAGGAVAFGLFLLMMSLVTNRTPGIERQDDLSAIDFIHYEQDTETETKDRRKPPEEPPPPPKQLQQPEAVAKVEQKVRQPMPQMDIPNMNIDVGSGSGPFIGNFSTGETSGIDTDATPISRVPPQYPLEARRKGTQGFVTLEFTIRPDGSVTDISVVNSHPAGVFEQAARQALSRWKFEPREEGGRKVARRARQTIRFTLNSG